MNMDIYSWLNVYIYIGKDDIPNEMEERNEEGNWQVADLSLFLSLSRYIYNL